MSLSSKIVVGVAVALLAIQLVPVDRSNPPAGGEIAAPPDVKALLERACYDCHSGQTEWPWYSRIAPVSWLVAHDVEEGREHLDFEHWDALEPKRAAHKLEELAEEVEEGEMPLWFYVPLHPEADLSDAERERLVSWANETRAAMGVESDGHDDHAH